MKKIACLIWVILISTAWGAEFEVDFHQDMSGLKMMYIVTDGGPTITPGDSWYIQDVRDKIFWSKSRSCGPEAGANVTNWWGYAYTFDEIAAALNWEPDCGVFLGNMLTGLQSLMPDLTVEMTGADMALIREEISSNRPVIFYCEQFQHTVPHYVTVVGYDGNTLIVHGQDVSDADPVLSGDGSSNGCFIGSLF